MAERSEQGTGKHPHKSTEEPYPHTKGSESGERKESRGESSGSRNEQRQSGSGTSQGGPTSDTRDLKEREYRDKEGNVHHHTHTADAMKDEKKAS